jgi:membrane dipeptidase
MRYFLFLVFCFYLNGCSINEKNASIISVETLHNDTLTLDTHIDIPLTYMTEIDPSGTTELQVDLPKLQKGNLDSGFWIVYTPQDYLTKEAYAEAVKIAEIRNNAIHALTKKHSDYFELALKADDVSRIVNNGKHAVLIGMENAFPLGENLKNVKIWAERGVRYMGITHFGHNQFGDSSNPSTDRNETTSKWNGLSPLGRELISSLNDAGIIVDVSHAAKSTMMQAADLSRVPVIASHSGIKSINDNPRNLDDEQLLKLKETGGVVQVVAYGSYVKGFTEEQKKTESKIMLEFNLLSRSDVNDLGEYEKLEFEQASAELLGMEPLASVSDYVDHIDYAVKIAGIDHVGIASDFDGGGGVIGWQDASESQNVTAELIKRGYSESHIAKIWSENLLRVMKEAELGSR